MAANKPGENTPPADGEKKTRKQRDPNAPKREIMTKVPDGHKRIHFIVPDSVHEHLKAEGAKDFRDANQYAYVTIMKSAGTSHSGGKS